MINLLAVQRVDGGDRMDQIGISSNRGLTVFEIELGNGVKWKLPLARTIVITHHSKKSYTLLGWNYDIFGS